MIMGALPETPGPAFNRRRLLLKEGEVHLVDQRAIAEQPGIGPAAQVVAGFIEFGGIKRQTAILNRTRPA